MSMDGLPLRWSRPAMVGFRCCFAYLLLYNVSSVLWLVPWKGEWLAETYQRPWDQLGVWVGDTLFGVDAHRHPTGSGDTWADYVLSFDLLVISALATIVWSLLDRRRLAYPRLLDALRTLVRVVLGTTLVFYGLAKVFWTQFPPPDGESLLRAYGDSSPMGLLWTFMGYSYGYNLFTGIVECLGVLLFWRRTALLGALVAAATMTQVFVLNLCFDVPVKLYSLHLLLMAVWLTLPDLRRLADFFLFHRAVVPRPLRVPFERRWLERARVPVTVVVLGLALYRVVDRELDSYDAHGPGATRHPMQDIYRVERHAVAGVEKPSLASDATRWKRVTLGRYQRAVVVGMDDSRVRYAWAIDEAARTITLTPDDAKQPAIVLRYTRVDDAHLELAAAIAGRTHALRVARVPRSSFLLVRRGFHWHQEYPFNR